MKLLLVVATVIAATSMANAASIVAAKPASRQSPGKQEGGSSCDCVTVWIPVCGADGKTYGNECEAKCKYVEIAQAGECPTEGEICRPTLEYNPQCGKDGVTYVNPGAVYCAGTWIDYRGPCLKIAYMQDKKL